MAELGRYIYCIIEADGPKSFGAHGMPDGLSELYTVNDRDLAAVVSQSPVIEYPVTREHSMSHQRAIEAVMKEHAVLPVSFCTIAQTEAQIITQVLRPRYDEFKQLLAWVGDKEEVSIKANWLTMQAIFEEINNASPELKQMKAVLTGKQQEAAYYDLIDAGRLVERLLGEKRDAEQTRLLERLKPLAVEHCVNRVYGESMIAHLAFLIEKAKEEAFHQAVSTLQEELAGRMHLKYIIGAPPFNFVTIVIHLEAEQPSEGPKAQPTASQPHAPQEQPVVGKEGSSGDVST